MSANLMSAVWKHGPEDRSQRLLMLALGDYADDKGICWPSTQEIAAKACYDVRTVLRRLKALEAHGWLKIARRSHQHNGNTYELDLSKLTARQLDHSRPTALLGFPGEQKKRRLHIAGRESISSKWRPQ
jgi:hypothetical protein